MTVKEFLKSKNLNKEVGMEAISLYVNSQPNEYVYKDWGLSRGEKLESVYYSKEDSPFKNKLIYPATFVNDVMIEE